MGMIEELTKAGWQRLGDHSTYWKAPDDAGPSGKKWTVGPAYTEMLVAKPPRPSLHRGPSPRALRNRAPSRRRTRVSI